MERRERLDFNFIKVKAADPEGDQGTFSGLAATYDLDQGNDRIVPGAFSRTLQNRKVVPLLWQHQTDNPIGSVTCTETSQGLSVEGQIDLSDPVGKRAFNLIKAKVLGGLSIGYTALQDSFEDGVRLLKEIKLYEISCVTFPMNEGALIASVKNVKALSDSMRVRHLKSIDDHRRAIDRHQRGMREDMKALFGDELFGDDDPALESPDDADDGEMEGMSMLLSEMKAMVTQAREFAEA